MVLDVTKTSQKAKNKISLSIEKNVVEWDRNALL